MKSLLAKRLKKEDREKAVLIGLVSLHLETGRAVGSQTLQENGFNFLSPATLRNYFAKLEKEGFLTQHHTSGGRVPTPLAYKVYAESVAEKPSLPPKEAHELASLLSEETREVQAYLQKAAETISTLTKGATFLSAPRFDQDFVQQIKLVGIDTHRVLCVLLTDFGLVRSEVLLTPEKLSSFALKRIESFFEARLTGNSKPELAEEEEKIANTLYNEAMFRHITSHSSFALSDIVKTGFSKVLSYPEFSDATTLSGALSLLEDDGALRSLLSACQEKETLSFWMGSDLLAKAPTAKGCSVLAIPYYIHSVPVGSIGILCPNRAPYERLFATLKEASKAVSESLTRSLYKFKISYREPKASELDLDKQTALLSQTEGDFLLEDKTSMRNE